jgi:ferredoxin-NADP reductase
VAGTAVLGRLTWLRAEVAETVAETPTVRSLVLDVPGWGGHRAGQHLDVRLTAEDGYQAQRSYSIASAPGEPPAITVERLEDGEVSPYLVDEVRSGDVFEVRGPIGGWFVWEARSALSAKRNSGGGPGEPGGPPGERDPTPLLLVAGGSGIVPLMAMIRHRAAADDATPTRLVYSSRTLEDVIYRDELDELAHRGDGLEAFVTLTRSQPAGWTGYARRIDRTLLDEVAWPPDRRPLVFVCGSTGFVEAAASALVDLGHEAARIKTERFGATGT